MGAEVPKKALHVHVHVQVFHQAFDACTKVKRQSTENEKRKKFLQFFCLILILSLSSRHKERAHSHDLPLQVSFASLGSTTRRAADFFFFFFLFFFFSTLP